MPRIHPLTLCCAMLTLIGCSGEMSVEDARQAAVVTVAGVEFDGATLERVLLASPPQSPGPSRETAAVVLAAFIDAALMREALVRGDSLTDSLTVMEAIAPDAIRGQILQLLEQRAAGRPEPTDEQADSLGRLGGVRSFQHILIRVEDPTDSAQAARAVARIRTVMDELIRPDAPSFSEVARRVSEDTATAPSGGFLPPLRQRDLPTEARFADQVWALGPGEMTRLVITRAGVHVVRRATLVEGRPAFKQFLRPALTRTADSLWVDSLAASKSLTLADDAVSRMRELSVEPYHGGGDAPLATWQGGELTADETRMWVSVLPITERVALPMAPDSALTLFVEQLAERDLVAAEATTERVTPRAWEALAPQYRAAVAAVVEQYQDGVMTGDRTTALRNYMVDISTGDRAYRPLPGALGGLLRRNAEVTLNQPAIDAIIRSAGRQWQLLHGTDTTTAAAAADTSAADSGTAAIP